MTVNARSSGGNITGQLFIGNDEVVARNQRFSIKTDQGKSILYADKDKIHFAADKLEFLSKYFIYFLALSHFFSGQIMLYPWNKSLSSGWCVFFLPMLIHGMGIKYYPVDNLTTTRSLSQQIKFA